MTNGHAPTTAETELVVLQMPPAAARRLRSVARTLSYVLTALLSSGATRACSVREEPRVSVAGPNSSKCSPPCPPGQTCRSGTCYAVATEEKTAAGECLPAVEIIFRTRQ